MASHSGALWSECHSPIRLLRSQSSGGRQCCSEPRFGNRLDWAYNKPLYGFVYVDMDDDGNGDLSRSRKDSFYYMQKVYKSNGEDLD